ncbi:MAG: FecR domain-containing protein [Candidatus Sumerlaeia bacterium]|nr:FecR domain-containing protein [Candidatus Sumerlaeia bacterium]
MRLTSSLLAFMLLLAPPMALNAGEEQEAPAGEGEEVVTEPALERPTLRRRERVPAPDVTEGNHGVVYEMSEDAPVQHLPDEEAGWQTRMETTQLRVGHQVRTLDQSTAKLVLRGVQDELRLPPRSHIEIEQLDESSQDVSLFLHGGSVWSQVSPRGEPDAFRVRTPELTAGVRGTLFRVDNADGSSQVTVVSGTVHVTANRTGVSVTLRENQAAVVNADGQILDLLANPVDPDAIMRDWDDWSADMVGASGSVAGMTPIGNLSQQIAMDNAQWEATMQEHMRNVAELRYAENIDEFAGAFARFANDTGVIPESQEEAWSLIKFGEDLDGWDGPYVEGAVPPLDPWRNPLMYRKVTNPAGRVFARVYSFGPDGRDDGGVNSSRDIIAHVLYFDLERFRDDPSVNPPLP